MYLATVTLHSLLRWLVLAFALVAIIRAYAGWFGNRPWTPLDDRAGKLLAISVDVQMLVGLVLYGLLSPITWTAFADMGAAMRDATLRFYAVEHLVLMVIAIALVHVGLARARKAAPGTKQHRTAAIFYTLALVLVFAGIPWPFRGAIARPLFPVF
jgi:hypothetical protein